MVPVETADRTSRVDVPHRYGAKPMRWRASRRRYGIRGKLLTWAAAVPIAAPMAPRNGTRAKLSVMFVTLIKPRSSEWRMLDRPVCCMRFVNGM